MSFSFSYGCTSTLYNHISTSIFFPPSDNKNKFIYNVQLGYYFVLVCACPLFGCIYRLALSGHYRQHSQHTATWDREGEGKRELMAPAAVSHNVYCHACHTVSSKTCIKPIYAVISSALLLQIQKIFLCDTTKNQCTLTHFMGSFLWALLFSSSLPYASSTFSHLCIEGCIPSFSTIWRLNSSLLVAMKGMLNTALMCNLSLHKHYRSWPTPGINATDLSYTSRAQLEEMGEVGGGGWLFEGDLFNLNLNLHRALCKCVQPDIFALSSCLNTKCSWQNQDAFYRGGRIQVCGR